MALNPLPHGSSLPDSRAIATVGDLLKGRRQGWREHEGRLIASDLDPVRLVQHFRSIRACGYGLGRPRPEGGKWVTNDLLEVLYLALLERGWLISKKAVVDAWWLASLDPMGPVVDEDPF